MLILFYIALFSLHTCLCVDYTYYIKEGNSPGTYLGDIGEDTHLMDSIPSSDHYLIRFSQLQKDKISSSQLFNVSKTGKFFITQTLDAEALCKYKRKCFRMVDVAVQKRETFVRILEIKVVIEDANDHQPEFPSEQVNLQFSEGDKKGTTRSIPNAIDRDVSVTNSQITYELIKKKDEPFSLAVSKRVDGTYSVGITLEKELNREVKNTYQLEIIAKDGGSPPKQGILNVHIAITDVNDNSPVFSQNIYNVSISSRHYIDKPIITLTATDLDSSENGKVLYHFSSKTSDVAKAHFQLDEVTGEIFLCENFPFGKRQTYELYIESTDGGNPPLSAITMVLVNVINQQNNAPIIDMNFVSKSSENMATISEGIKVGSFIAYVKVTDNDSGQNGEITCDLHHDKFQLLILGRKKYKVVLKSLADKEKESYINFTVICKDKGSPPLQTEREFSIQVLDVNDVQPQFTKNTYKFLTYENEEPNFPVGFVNATDPDLGSGGLLTYLLVSKDIYALPFQITDYGFISTSESLNREQRDIYIFQVLVKDNGIPPLNNTANVVVEVMDENDNAPYFTFPNVNPFNLEIHYNPESKNDITVLRASDKDSKENGFLRYEILGGNDRELFTVNPYTGVLSFSRRLYQNDARTYSLQLVVKDSGTPVLSATTTLSLTLTVSNTTSTMLTAVDTQSDFKIQINLFIIIIAAAVAISVILVISITICVVQKNNLRKSPYRRRVDPSNKSLDEDRQSDNACESSQYDAPSTMSDVQNRNPYYTASRKPLSRYNLSINKKQSIAKVPCQATCEEIHQIYVQKAHGTSGCGKDKVNILNSPYHYSQMSTISHSGCDWGEGETEHYEELPGCNSYRRELLQNKGSKSLPRILNSPKDIINVKCSYQPNVHQNTLCNDVVDLKSTPLGSSNPNISEQPWNLPMRNSFSSFTKPLPAVPKIPYS